MSRRSSGHQRTWVRNQTRPCPFLWPWQGKYFSTSVADRERKLALLERVWNGSRNYAALFDALEIITDGDISCRWVTAAARDALQKPKEYESWAKRHLRDRLDIVRADRFEEGRDPETGVGLSRVEAAQFAADSLAGSPAATTREAVLKLMSAMKRNEARAYGRYYVGVGSLYWETEYFPRVWSSNKSRLIWKWRHRAAVRGNARMRDAELADLRHVRQLAARGDRLALETLKLYDRVQREDAPSR